MVTDLAEGIDFGGLERVGSQTVVRKVRGLEVENSLAERPWLPAYPIFVCGRSDHVWARFNRRCEALNGWNQLRYLH